MASTGSVPFYDLEEDFLTFSQLRRSKLLFRSSAGEIWKVKTKFSLEKSLVVKTFWLNDPETRGVNNRQFISEVDIMKTLKNDHVMKIGVAARCPDYAAYAMPYYSRGSLVESPVDLEPRLAHRYTRQVAQALAHMHQHHIAHNDVKLDNVMVGRSDRVVLADFGHSLKVKESGVAMARHVGGTECYWSPERWAAKDADMIDPYKGDVFALGVLYWLLLSGEQPDEDTDYLDQVITCDNHLTKSQRSVLLELLNPDPTERPTASQALNLLQTR